jgi:prolyl-tRNA synthetase
MRQSQLFSKTRREAPQDEVSKNARLLVRAGFVKKAVAGAYEWLPLGLRVLENAAKIVREEMSAAGGQELRLTALQDPELWKETNRWDDAVVDNWFKTALKSGGELGLGFSHEEPMVEMLREHVSSYRDLPFSVFQIQTKFRNELRAKSGVLRGREFLMKDAYSFAANQEQHAAMYERYAEAYARVFARAGIGHITRRAVASGGVFSGAYSDEFQVECEAGEDSVIILPEGETVNRAPAVNAEVISSVAATIGLEPEELAALPVKRCVEVGNIFHLGTKYAEALGLNFANEAGERVPVIMGCYGIGVSRLVGAVVEALGDEKGSMVWPDELAPFKVHLVALGVDEAVSAAARDVYDRLRARNVEVLWDDRDLPAGAKLADADLIGCPVRVVIGRRSLERGAAEVVDRRAGESREVPLAEVTTSLPF